MKYFIITYGCQMNKSDSERIAEVLEKIGYKPALKENEANLIVVNMCSVRQSAVDRVYGKLNQIPKLKNQNEKVKCKIILTGCILPKDKKKFKNQVDYILDIKNLLNWPKILTRSYKLKAKSYLNIQPKYQNNSSAFLPISTGCNNFCTYCVVPYARGPLICRPHQEILKEAKNVIKKSFKEIWLLGQNVNRYCSRAVSFAKLLKMMNDIPGNFWIRFTSSHPTDFSEELIETMARCEKVTPYLNLPVQSGDDKILKRMNRPYTVERYKNLIKKIRAAFKKHRKSIERETAISTDIIVGFPGETKKQFENTIKLFKEVKYDMAYIAKYSPRPGTAATKLKDNVSSEEKEKRYKALTKILKETALEKNKKYIGKEIEVLIDNSKDNFYFGKTRSYKTVKINLIPKTYHLKPKLIGQFVKVKIINATPFGLRGKLV